MEDGWIRFAAEGAVRKKESSEQAETPGWQSGVSLGVGHSRGNPEAKR